MTDTSLYVDRNGKVFVSLDKLREFIKEFPGTLDDVHQEEWYFSELRMGLCVMKWFEDYVARNLCDVWWED